MEVYRTNVTVPFLISLFFPSRKIDLGRDTSICKGDSLHLIVGSGFSSYQWSTGNSTAAVSARAQGVYWVKAKASDGCVSSDTFVIRQLFNLPEIKLSHDSTMCINSSKVLDAGSGFNSYLWSTGSPERKIEVYTTGTYSVSVIDQNGCKGFVCFIIHFILLFC